MENQGQLHRPDIFFYTTSGDVQVGFLESAVLVKIVERVSAPVSRPESPSSVDLSPPHSRGVLVRIAFEGANPVRPEGVDRLPHRSHYFLGNDPAGWRTDVAHYGQVVYRDLYDGVDVAYRIGAEGLKYDITVRPGVDLGRVAMAYEGVDGLEADDGSLIVRTALGDLSDSIPRSYQGKEEVECRFDLRAPLSYGFDCLARDASRPLVIDPLVYSTFLGGAGGDWGYSIAVDGSGSAYLTGLTWSLDFPTTPGAFNSSYQGDPWDAFVTKLNPAGTALVFSTYLGGGYPGGMFDADQGNSIAVDASGSAYVTGYTDSADFPTTPGAFDTTLDIDDAFVTKLNPAGSDLVYSTFLGGFNGYDRGNSIAVDASGNAYVTGSAHSTDFPTTPGAFDRSYNGGFTDAFVTKLNPAGTALVYSTFLGGSSDDEGNSIAVDPSGNAFVTGWTRSTDFPTTPGAFDNSSSPWDAFVTKLNPAGTALVYSTFLGGSNTDEGSSIAVDGSGSAYVTGKTSSTGFPTTPGAFDTTINGPYGDAFVTKLTPAGSGLDYSTFLGGSGEEIGNSIAVDASGSAYVTGFTDSTNFPTTPGAFDSSYNGGNPYRGDAFVTKLNPAGSDLAYSTFLGGSLDDEGLSITVDAPGRAYVTGGTRSTEFPTTPGAFDTAHSGNVLSDAFVTKLNLSAGPNAPPLVTLTSPVGGEVWDQGSSHVVTWTASDSQDSSTSLVVFVNYTSSAGGGMICGPVPGTPGSYDWIVPAIVAADVIVNGTVIDTGGLKGWGESGPFTIQAPPNAPPVADAGPDGATVRNATMILDGSGSSDPDGDPITFRWTQVAGPNAIPIANADVSVASVVPTMVGTYTFNLTVTDDRAASAYDWVDVVVLNQGPVANAGTDKVSFQNTLVTLDGSASLDLDGDPLTYSWSQVAGPLPVVLISPDTSIASYTTPTGASASGQYTFSLAVADSFGANDTDEVTITVSNRAPIADAGLDRTDLLKRVVIALDGTASTDPDGDVLTFLWTQIGGPLVILAAADTPVPSFSATKQGTYVFRLTVSDGDGGGATDTVTLFVVNSSPRAEAGPDQFGALGATLHLDGSPSSDPDGDPLAFSWVQMSGPAVSLSGPDGPGPSFVPDLAGAYVFRLTVGDGDGGDASDEVTITVTGAATAIGVEVYAALVIVILVAIILVLFVLGRRRRKSDPEAEPEPRG